MADPVPAATAVLERRCRALLLAYPPAYRDRWGDEIVATLIDGTDPARRRPPVADAADIVAAGVRQRLGPTAAGCASGLRLAAPFALALAAGISAYLWLRVEPVTVHTGGFLDGWRTAGPIAYAGWLLAALAVAVRPAIGRAVIGTALVLTVLLPVVSSLTTVERPPVWVLMVLVGLGAVALTGQGGSLSADERMAIPAGAVAVASVTSALGLFWPAPAGGDTAYYQPTIARVGVVVGLTAAVALILAARQRPSRQSWLWAATLLALLAGWLGPVEYEAGAPRFGRLAEVLLASCVAGATLLWLARAQPPSSPPPVSAPPVSAPRLAAAGGGSVAATGSVALGSAVGIGAFLVLGAAGGFGFAGGSLDGYAVATVGLVALAGLFAVSAARRIRLGWAGAGAVLGAGAAWAVAAYDNGWTMRGWTNFARTADLVCTVAFVPLFLCAVVAARALSRSGRRVALTGALLSSLAWLGPATLPYAASWGPQLAVLLACLGVLAVSRRRDPAAVLTEK